MKETIFCGDNSFFEIPPGILRSKKIRLEPTKDSISIVYGIKSQQGTEEVLKLRPQISQLIQGIFGDGFQSYDSELYLVMDNHVDLVGFVRSRIPNLTGGPLLSTPSECILLLYMILNAQLEYKSPLVDGILAALSMANMGGFVNTGFAWAWWGLEWLIQDLDELNPLPRKLDFQVDVHDGRRKNVRKYFKKQILNTMDEFSKAGERELIFSPLQKERFEREMEAIRNQINNSFLSPTFIEKFENQIPFISGIINAFLSSLKYSPIPIWSSESNLKALFTDWSQIIENIIHPAKEARDGGFHTGKYTGILEGERFEIYTGMKKFVGWVCSLLAIILTRNPYEYDPRCKIGEHRFVLDLLPDNEIQNVKPQVPNEGFLEWSTHVNGVVETHSTPVRQVELSDDWQMEFKPELVPIHSPRGCLVDRRESRNADFIFKASGVQVAGEYKFDEKSHLLKIHRFIAI